MLRLILLAQGAYYLVTGLWPLLHMPSFTAVSGPKHDLWLVRTVGVLVASVGAALAMAAVRQQPPREVAVLAAGSGIGLAAIDVTYACRRRISLVYLLDAAEELAALTLLVAAWRRGRARP